MTPNAGAPKPSADCAAVEEWRHRRRELLLDRRAALSEAAFRNLSKTILQQVEKALAGRWGRRFGLYWPRRHEVALFPLVRRVIDGGGLAALPGPSADGALMRFRAWTPGDPLAANGVGLSFPRDGPFVTPDVVFLPLLGFDADNYRLGYGGGSYNRLLVQEPRPHTIGVGFEFMRLQTIRPRPEEVPLDLIVTEAGVGRLATRDGPRALGPMS